VINSTQDFTMTKNLTEESRTLNATTRAAWRKWLEENSEQETEVWLIFERGQDDKTPLTYEEAVLEGLLFGWIDSIVQRIDDQHYARKFNVRKDWKTWSESNRQRIRLLVREGAHFLPGVLARIPAEVFDETVQGPPPPGKNLSEAPDWLAQVLQSSPTAWATLQGLSPSHQRRYIGWILDAKKLETQQ
jgi:uncharacterized protein YdeI (YjbR/CyaY-like superfamily)